MMKKSRKRLSRKNLSKKRLSRKKLSRKRLSRRKVIRKMKGGAGPMGDSDHIQLLNLLKAFKNEFIKNPTLDNFMKLKKIISNIKTSKSRYYINFVVYYYIIRNLNKKGLDFSSEIADVDKVISADPFVQNLLDTLIDNIYKHDMQKASDQINKYLKDNYIQLNNNLFPNDIYNNIVNIWTVFNPFYDDPIKLLMIVTIKSITQLFKETIESKNKLPSDKLNPANKLINDFINPFANKMGFNILDDTNNNKDLQTDLQNVKILKDKVEKLGTSPTPPDPTPPDPTPPPTPQPTDITKTVPTKTTTITKWMGNCSCNKGTSSGDPYQCTCGPKSSGGRKRVIKNKK